MKKELLNCVVVSNDFARYAEINLSVSEWKLLLYMISRIKKHERMFLSEKFSVCEFKKIMGVSATSIVRKAVENLNVKTCFIKEKEYRLLEHLCIDGKFIKYKFDEQMKPHLLGLHDNMTIFELGWIYNMNSKYTIRMYIFGTSFKFMTYYNCSEDDFKRVIGFAIPRSELERRALMPALKEINNTTDIFLHVKFKGGRYYFAAAEKSKNQKRKYGVEHWKTLIEETDDYNEITREPFNDLNFDEL